jgi:predicted nuclease of restriction endonuclease-like RecB superfamily
MKKIAFLFALFLASGISAQNLEQYLLFDAVCMQKFDYERNEEYKDLAFWDYHLKLNDNKTLIFRVLKQENNIIEIRGPVSVLNHSVKNGIYIGKQLSHEKHDEKSEGV